MHHSSRLFYSKCHDTINKKTKEPEFNLTLWMFLIGSLKLNFQYPKVFREVKLYIFSPPTRKPRPRNSQIVNP